jgi:hypothetical protein
MVRERDAMKLPQAVHPAVPLHALGTSCATACEARKAKGLSALNAFAVLKRNEGSMRRALCAALFFLVGFNPPLGELRIEASTGGEVSHYLEFLPCCGSPENASSSTVPVIRPARLS